jgi:hypothetical protein
MTASQDLLTRLVERFPALEPLLHEHLRDQDGELLPYLLLADVARWAQESFPSDPQLVGDVLDWLEEEYERAEAAEQDLIGLGFVETIPYRPAGAPLLTRLGPELTKVAAELGLLTDPTELG